MIWHTEQRKINDLLPYPRNPRTMTGKQASDLKKSLEKFGLAEIPAINLDNMICAGHQRLRTLQELGRGDEMVDVRVPDRMLTPEEFKEYNARSNKNTGSFDFDMLAADFEIADLQDIGFSDVELGLGPKGDEDDVTIKEKFVIEVQCFSEEEQERTYNKLLEQGYECRLLTL